MTGAYDKGGHNRLVGAVMAFNEINDKTDGQADTLLPNTQLKFEFIDSQRSSAAAVAGATNLIDNAFDGSGIDVVVGPASSDPSMR